MKALERPFRPVDLAAGSLESFDLHGLALRLAREPQYLEEGRAGLARARNEDLSVVLEVLRAGSELREHRAPSSATLALFSGRATFVSGPDSRRTEMAPGTLVALAAALDHSLVAHEDSACLLVIGGRSRTD